MKSPIADLQSLTDEFVGSFPAQLRGPRTIGREAEHPLVDASGAFVDVSELLPELAAPGDLTPKYDAVNREQLVELSGKDFSYALEVGKGTIEINTRPCADLFQAALARLQQAADPWDWRVLGYGIQPVSPPSLPLLTPKQRYEALLERIVAASSSEGQKPMLAPKLATSE